MGIKGNIIIFFLGCFFFQFSTSSLSGQCNDPTNQMVSGITDNDATLLWDADPLATEYRVACRIRGTRNWVEAVNVSGTSFQAGGLYPGTEYEWGIRTICSGSTSNFIFGPPFTTTGPAACGIPQGLLAVPVSENTVNLRWDGSNGSTAYRLIYWIRDALGSDTDPSPNFLYETITTNNAILTGLQSGTTYFWTVRNICDAIPMQSDLSGFDSFETQGTVRCVDPVNLVTSYTAGGEIEISCDPAYGAAEYRFAYHEVGSTEEWVSIIQISQMATIPNIVDGAEYEWGVRAICPDDNTVSAFIYGNNFTGGDRCRVPTNLRSFERRFGMVLRWNNKNEALSYDLQIRELGTSAWTTYSVNTIVMVVTGATAGVTYEWRVRSLCATDGSFASAYSDIEAFMSRNGTVISPQPFLDKRSARLSSSRTGGPSSLSLEVHHPGPFLDLLPYEYGPNPAVDKLMVRPVLTERINQVVLYHATGSRAMTRTFNSTSEITLFLNSLPAGHYVMVLSTDSGVYRERLIRLY